MKTLRKDTTFIQRYIMVLAAAVKVERVLFLGVGDASGIKQLRESFPQAQVVGIDKDFSKAVYTNFHALQGDVTLPSMFEAVTDAFNGYEADMVIVNWDPSNDSMDQVLGLWKTYGKLLRTLGVMVLLDFDNHAVERTFDYLSDHHNSAMFVDSKTGEKMGAIYRESTD